MSKFRILFLCAVMALSNALVFAQQYEASYWYFGDGAGIKFEEQNGQFIPQALSGGQIKKSDPTGWVEGVSSISDKKGNLLFYSDGIGLWDNNHVKNPNTMEGHPSSSQSGVIVPDPKNPDLYYIIVTGDGELTATIARLYQYNLSTKLLSSQALWTSPINATEKIIATRQRNSDNIFVIIPIDNSTSYHRLVFDGNGYNVTTETMPSINTRKFGRYYGSKISADGKYLAVSNVYNSTDVNQTHIRIAANTIIYEFDNQNGKIGNQIWKANACSESMEFSSENPRFLYFTVERAIVASYGITATDSYYKQGVIYQVDLEKMNTPDYAPKSINTTVDLVANGGIQMGMDGRIYVSRQGKQYLGRIEYPELEGASAVYNPTALKLADNTYCSVGLPLFIQSYIQAPEFTYTNSCLGTATKFTCTGMPTIDSLRWDFGDGSGSNVLNPDHLYAQADTYYVSLRIYRQGQVRTSKRNVVIFPAPVISINNLASSYLLNDPSVSLSASPAGGVFSGPGVNGVVFNPSIAGVGYHTITYTLNSNGCIYEKSQSVLVSDACPYSIGKGMMNNLCSCLTNTELRIPLILTGAIKSGIIGLDFCLNYDQNILVPDSFVEIGNVFTNNGLYAQGIKSDYQLNTSENGRLHISLFYKNQAPQNAQMINLLNDTIVVLGFKLKSELNELDTLIFSSCELRESYALETLDNCVNQGYFVAKVNNDIKGNLIFWNKNELPIKYDQNSPDNYLITNIKNKTGVITQPDLNGNFEINSNGMLDFLKIIRDIPGSYNQACNYNGNDSLCDITRMINGYDCFLTGLVTTMDSSYKPSVYEIMSMDVNQNASVDAGDITHIQNRFLNGIYEFPQLWNYKTTPPKAPSKDWVFINGSLLSADNYKIGLAYPYKTASNTGYTKYLVPLSPDSLIVDIDTTDICSSYKNDTYNAILLGDADGSWENLSVPVTMKKEAIQSIKFELNNAFENNGQCYIPISYSADAKLFSLDLIMESYNKEAIDFVSFDYAAAKSGELSMAFNNNIRFTSYLKNSSGLESDAAIVYLVFKGDLTKVNSNDFGKIIGYFNGEKTDVQLISNSLDVEKLNENSISIYPNPAHDFIHINSAEAIQKIQVYNISGSKMLMTENQNTLNISNLEKGIYFIQVCTAKQSKTMKFILE